MRTLSVIYWSATGSTAAMAGAVAEGAKAAGAETRLIEVSQATPDDVKNAQAVAFGCPAMGAEVLEEAEFEPFFQSVEPFLSGKSVALFGSYGWGDGQWMREWYGRAESDGASLCGGEGLILNGTPDENGLEACRALGRELAS